MTAAGAEGSAVIFLDDGPWVTRSRGVRGSADHGTLFTVRIPVVPPEKP